MKLSVCPAGAEELLSDFSRDRPQHEQIRAELPGPPNVSAVQEVLVGNSPLAAMVPGVSDPVDRAAERQRFQRRPGLGKMLAYLAMAAEHLLYPFVRPARS